MKKFLMLILTFLIYGTANALPIGNPATPNFFEYCNHCDDECGFFPVTRHFFCGGIFDNVIFQIGYRGNFVNDRYLEKEDGPTHENLYYFQVHTNAGYVAFDFYDRIEIYATLGATQIELAGNARNFINTAFASQIIVNTNSALSWSWGGRLILLEWNCFTLGAQAEYFQAKLNLNKEMNMSEAIPEYFNNAPVTYVEWEASLGLSYQYYMDSLPIALYPYAALSFSKANLNTGNFAAPLANPPFVFTLVDYQSSRLVGYALGISLVFCDSFAITAEGRWANEEAFSVCGSMRF